MHVACGPVSALPLLFCVFVHWETQDGQDTLSCESQNQERVREGLRMEQSTSLPATAWLFFP